MPNQKEIPYNSGHFFITFTCYQWLPLIELTKSNDLIYKWFDYLKHQGHYITGYTIMPNYVHATIAFSFPAMSSQQDINPKNFPASSLCIALGVGQRKMRYFSVSKNNMHY